MTSYAIRVEHLSKLYHIGQYQGRYKSLRESLSNAVQRQLKALKNGRQSGPEDNTIWALKDVSFDVQPGEVVGIIGRNGAGKSTLLKILARITEPSEGTVRVRGRVGSLLEVGTGFHPELTGRENIFLNGAILGMSRREIQSKFDEIVDFAEIEKFIDTPVKHYSSGMYMRLAFAVAAHLEPEILIVDEVLAVGDAQFQKKCLGKMCEVAKGGRTVLFVSHNFAAVSQLCRNAYWLDDGSVVSCGPSYTVIEKYLLVIQKHIGKVTWENVSVAPGDERIRLLGVRAVQLGVTSSVIDINNNCFIEIEFQVLQDIRNLVTGINLYNADGICLLDSCDWRPNHFQSGRYRKSVQIPAQTLAEGTISVLVQLVFYDPDIRSVVEPSILILNSIESDHDDSVRGLYKGPWPGVLRLKLDWSNPEIVKEE